MTKLELVINEVILKIKYPLTEEAVNEEPIIYFILSFLFDVSFLFEYIYLLVCFIKHRCLLVLDRDVLNNRCAFSEKDVSGKMQIGQTGQGKRTESCALL